MKKINKATLVKILGLLMTVGAAIASDYTVSKETEEALEEMVDKKFNDFQK